MKSLRIPLRIVFYRESDAWIAHCLEFDLCGDGETKEAALDNLSEAVRLQLEFSVEQSNFGNLFAPAGGKFFQMFAAGTDITVGRLNFTNEALAFDATEMREFVGNDTQCV
jgi:predicted RNase H-like HicB family nuclease